MSNTPTSKVEALREKLFDSVDKHFPKGACKERGAAMVLTAESIIAFATFLEELELGEKDKRRGWASDSDIVYISGRNHGIDQTRTLIQAQVKELRKI